MDVDKIRADYIKPLQRTSEGEILDLVVDIKADVLLADTAALEVEFKRLALDVLSASIRCGISTDQQPQLPAVGGR